MADSAVKWSPFYITDWGLALRQKAIAEGIPIEFLRGELGAGKPERPEDVWEKTALIDPFPNVTLKIKESSGRGANHVLILLLSNKMLDDEHIATEMGVLARLSGSDDVGVYGYSYTEKGYESIPAFENQEREWEFVFNTRISRASNVEIIYDGTIIYATHEDIKAHNEDPYAHSANNAQQATHELVTLQHNLNRLPGCDAACLEYAAGIAPAGEGYPGGTDPVTFRPEVKYHSRNALTVLVPQKYAREVAAVNQLRENEYAVIYKEGIESLLILLR